MRTPVSRALLSSIVIILVSSLANSQGQLKTLSRNLDAQWKSDRARAESVATSLHMPIRSEIDGRTFELQRFEKGMPLYYTTENLNAAKTISTDKVWPGGGFGYFLSGSGITLGEWDAGLVRATHQEFSGGRVTSTDGAALNFHSTHVAGTMVAAGLSGTRKGMSFAGALHAYDWNNDLSEMAAQAAAGLRISNHSYGLITGWYYNYFSDSKWAWFGDVNISTLEDYRFGFYDNEAASFDAVAAAAPYYLIAKAAGNDRNEGPGGSVNHWAFIGGSWTLITAARFQDGNSGYDCIEGGSVSKNVLTVGAVDDLAGGYVNAAGVSMSSFSCWGPTDDGRIKPDIVANGVNVSSTFETADNAYGTLSGTSMATPNASGSVGLLLENYNLIHGDTFIRSSTMKGLIIHTADEAGTTPGPDYRFGWGLMNTLKAAQMMDLDNTDGLGSHIREILVGNHDTVRILVGSDGLQALKATLCWIDPAGTVSAPAVDPTTIKLVNDFDLRIIKRINASTSMPWILDPSLPASGATTGDNYRDNVEQVIVASPGIANYIVQITHKGTLSSPQYVSLIVSGNTPPLGTSFAVAPESLDVTMTPGSMRLDSLLITNSSDSTLLYHVAVPSLASLWISPVAADSGIVPATSSGYFRYQIDASLLSQWSSYSGSLDFTTNDELHPLVQLDVDLSTTGPKISPAPSTVVVDVDSGVIGSGYLRIANIGTKQLDFVVTDSALAPPSWLSLSSDTGSTAPGDTSAVLITAGDTLLPNGDYLATLAIASNDSLDGTRYVHVALHVGTRRIFTVSVANQWNLISLPVLPISPLKTDNYPSATSNAFIYRGSYAARESLRVGEGFWLKFNGAGTFGIDGYAVHDDTIDVTAGWNIVGSTTYPIPIATISSVPGGIVTSRFYGYDGAYVSTDTIRPGRGYWVKVNSTGKLILSTTPPAASSSMIRIDPTREIPPSPPEGGAIVKEALPTAFVLDQNYPNPFNPSTKIGYELPERSIVRLSVFNVLGVEIATLENGAVDAGWYTKTWDATGVASGLYFYRLDVTPLLTDAHPLSLVRKMILMR